ncbi:MAG: putative carboxypeptidase [Acidobacteria bacterium]|nr:putative carboxypeptidase [Acidobacteriota bacterium]
MSRHRCALIAGIAILLLTFCANSPVVSAQHRTRISPSSAIPSPRSVLGFDPGDEHTIADWGQITDYFQRLDKASDRVLVQTIGETTLKRPIIVAIISARENILALEKYKGIQRRLADPRLVNSEQDRDRLIQDGKVVVAISCSIHSTEIVASQMSLALAYELATAKDAETHAMLQNTILLLIPSANPDGVDIVADWYRKTLGTPFEGKEPPELYHHYAGHDDNRDWFMLNLKETKAITKLFWQEWFPEIVYDVHQQGSNGSRFFVPPFYDPPNPHIAPVLLRQVGLLGHKIAADLEATNHRGVLTNAVYDTWWHGGFRTAPYFHNSIGILTEAASARLMSAGNVTREQLARSSTRGMRNALEATTNFPNPWTGGLWRPRDIMNLELGASRSVLSMAANYRASYLRSFYELGSQTQKQEPGEPIAYLVPAGQGRDEAVAKMIGALIEQGVEVFRLERELHATFGPQSLQRTNATSEKLGDYRMIVAQTASMQEVPAGSYIVFLSQPQRSNILALFEPQIYPNRLNAVGEAERPYDVTGWTLPLQMGVDSPAVMAIQEKAAERRLTLIHQSNEVRKDLALTLQEDGSSPIANPLHQPTRVGIYKGWTANMDEGWTRFAFDTFNVPYKSLGDAEIKEGTLTSNYDVIVLPSQRAREITEGNAPGTYPVAFTGGITASGARNLQQFVTDGGTLICFDASCEFAIKQLGLPLRNVLENLKSNDFYCPGSILSLDVDQSQPLARGMARSVDAYFINSSAFEATDPSVHIIARYRKEGLLRSGWLLGEDKIKGRIALAEVKSGKGRVVLFGFRPQHRGQTWGTFQFIWNALAALKRDN